jgi:hypothetical protein
MSRDLFGRALADANPTQHCQIVTALEKENHANRSPSPSAIPPRSTSFLSPSMKCMRSTSRTTSLAQRSVAHQRCRQRLSRPHERAWSRRNLLRRKAEVLV